MDLKDEVFERMAVDTEGRSGNTEEIKGFSQSVVSAVKRHGFANPAAIIIIKYRTIDQFPIIDWIPFPDRLYAIPC